MQSNSTIGYGIDDWTRLAERTVAHLSFERISCVRE
jgi:hypothetical protein